ncbi:putative quorum-sensing-regulated virulence factor [Kaarinaea lacus]
MRYTNKGVPEGKLGLTMRIVYELKINGLEYLYKS